MKLPVELQSGEQVLTFARRHWMYMYPTLVAYALIAIIPVILLIFLLSKTVDFEGVQRTVALILSAVWIAYWTVRAYFRWYRYQNDVWLVTNQRLIDSLKKHWFHHQIASADLIDIEDVSVHRSGVLQTAFNFGDLRCQTAGEVANFVLAGIPDPAAVLTTLDAARDASRRELTLGGPLP